MSKKIKLQNSTILIIGIIIVLIGVFIGLYDFIDDKKNKLYSEMNVDLFENEQPEIIEEETEYKEPEKQEEIIEEEKENTNNVPVESYLGVLEIPKIRLKRGFYNINSKYNKVDYNITIINGSTYPEEKNNNLILAAHSGNCTICYFNDLYKLKINDEAYLYYKDTKYKYKLVKTYEEQKDGTVAIYRDYDKSCLTLITCTRNSNNKQTIYIFELIK